MLFQSSHLAFVAILAVSFAAKSAHCGDPNSITDHFRETNRDPGFESRRSEYSKLFADRYTGSSEQNKRFLRVVRASDALSAAASHQQAGLSVTSFNPTKTTLADEFGDWTPNRCRVRLEPSSSSIMRKIDSIAQRRGSCCGAGAICDHLTTDCLPYLRPQNQACATHDRRLALECKRGWNQFDDPCVIDAHRELAESSSDPLLRGTFKAMSRIGTGTTERTESKFSQPTFPSGYDWAK